MKSSNFVELADAPETAFSIQLGSEVSISAGALKKFRAVQLSVHSVRKFSFLATHITAVLEFRRGRNA